MAVRMSSVWSRVLPRAAVVLALAARCAAGGVPVAPSPDTSAIHDARIAIAEARAAAPSRTPETPFRAAGAATETWSEIPLISYNQSTLILDSANDRLVLYGGLAGEDVSTDVWVRSLAGRALWTRLDVAGPLPPAHAAHAAAYDPIRQRMIVYGNFAPDGTLGGVWALSLSGTPAWTRLDTGARGPGDRSGTRMVYDPLNDRMLVFGGYSWSADSLENEVWALSLTRTPRWVLLAPSGTPPSRQTESAVIFDSKRQRMVVFGGFDKSRNPYGGAGREVWALSLGDAPEWTQLHPAYGDIPRLFASAAAYDAKHDRMLVAAGANDSLSRDQPVQGTWALQFGDTDYWTQITPSGEQPSSRTSPRGVYDPRRDEFVLFGGQSSDTWALSLAGSPGWSLLEPGTGQEFGPRHAHAAVFDAARNRTLVFGGRFSYYEYHAGKLDEPLNDLWSLTLEPRPTWTRLMSDSAPLARSGHSMILDPSTDQLWVFGGVERHWEIEDGPPDIVVNNLWRRPLSPGGNWIHVDAGDSLPPARTEHAAILDPVRRRMIVFGGWGAGGALNDTWALPLDGTPRWTRLAAAGSAPPPRAGPAAVYDPVGDRMIVFGGGPTGDDTWQLSLSGTPTWSPLPSATRPGARNGASLAYDERRQRLVLFGGEFVDTQAHLIVRRSDAWVLPLAEGASWAPAAVGDDVPAGRAGAAAVYDRVRDRVIVLQGQFREYNGFDSEVDTWALSSSALVARPLSLVRVEAGPMRVVLQWQGSSDPAFTATVERRTAESAWATIGTVHTDPAGMLTYEDTAAQPATHYLYRLTWLSGAAAGSTAAVEVIVPRLRFALIGPSPNPAVHGLTVTLSLPDAAPARLELLDVSGREVLARDVGPLGAGDHALAIAAEGTLRPGVYLVRLRRAGASLVTRACVIR